MQIYAGLNPFLQSVNSPINGKNFVSPTNNYPVEGDSINVNPLTVPPYANPYLNQNMLVSVPPVSLQTSIAGGGWVTAPMLSGGAVGTVNLNSETYSLLTSSSSGTIIRDDTFSLGFLDAHPAGTLTYRTFFRSSFNGVATLTALQLIFYDITDPASVISLGVSGTTSSTSLVALGTSDELVLAGGGTVNMAVYAEGYNTDYFEDASNTIVVITSRVNGSAQPGGTTSLNLFGRY